MEKVYVTWKEVEEFVENIKKEFEGKINGVCGLPRGGLVFAVMISHKLNIPLLLAPAKGCLVVDDILDTGETMLHYKKSGYKIAVMHYAKTSVVAPDYTMVTYEKGSKEANRWIVYPWEAE